MSNENEEKRKRTWAWLKDKFADAVVNIVTTGVLFLISVSIILSATNEYRRAQDRTAIEKDLIDRHNQTVSRESDLIQEIFSHMENLSQKIAALSQEVEELKAQKTGAPTVEPKAEVKHIIPKPIAPIIKPDSGLQRSNQWVKSYSETYKQ